MATNYKFNIVRPDGTTFSTNDPMAAMAEKDAIAAAQLAAKDAEIASIKARKGGSTAELRVVANLLGGKLKSGSDANGNVGVYGLSARFPVTLYPNQWPKLAALIPTIAETIHANANSLSFRDDAEKATTLAWCAQVIEDHARQ